MGKEISSSSQIPNAMHWPLARNLEIGSCSIMILKMSLRNKGIQGLEIKDQLPVFSFTHVKGDRKGRDVSYDAPVVKAHQFPQHFNLMLWDRKLKSLLSHA